MSYRVVHRKYMYIIHTCSYTDWGEINMDTLTMWEELYNGAAENTVKKKGDGWEMMNK